MVLTNQVSKLKEDVERLKRKARNAEAREKRAKSACKTLLQQLSEKDLINSELEHQLQSYKGMVSTIHLLPEWRKLQHRGLN